MCEVLHVKLGMTRHTVGMGKKTCIGQLYGLLYNGHKKRFHNSVLRGSNTFVSVEHGLVSKTKHWKRSKHIYLIHEKAKNEITGKMELTESNEVSNSI